MTFGREKRLFLGGLALLAPLPLPFNEVLEWPVLFLYLLLVVAFLQRAEGDRETRPPNWVLNLLGLLYLPILAVDLQVSFFRGRVVTALLHLILFLVVVKLFALGREKEKWHLMVALFFVFVAAMATSSHLSVAAYLLVFTVASLWILARFAQLHVLAATSESRGRRAPLRFGRPLTAIVLLVVIAAVPLFAAVPRFSSPMVLGRGGANAGLLRSAGFSDQVDLSLTTSVRANRTVVMRVEVDRPRLDVAGMRFKGNAFDYYRDRSWHRDRSYSSALRETDDGLLLVASGERRGVNVVASGEIYLEPIGSTSLVLPVTTLGFEILGRPAASPSLGAGGDVALPYPPSDTLRYRVELAEQPVLASYLAPEVAAAMAVASDAAADVATAADETPIALADPVADPAAEVGLAAPAYVAAIDELSPSALDQGGITPRMRELAAEAMGEGPVEERIERLERYLREEYRYTLDFVGREGDDPIADFLFTYRSGHCELFATAMVLLLRSQGVPARLVTGFLGAEPNRLESYFVVRQSNSHAWVEAYAPGHGWGVYDPTPAEGRPGAAERDLGLLLAQLYDYLSFRWDRYVLSFGADDQSDLVGRLRAWIDDLRRRFRDDPEAAPPPEPPGSAEDGEQIFTAEAIGGLQPAWIVAAVVASGVLWLVLALVYRRRLDAAAAYRRLRALATRTGLELTPATPPLAVSRRLAARLPEAEPEIRRVVELYLAESFAARVTTAGERRELQRTLAAVEQATRRLRRRERRQRRRGARPAPAVG